jgi:hypothetical protein
MGCLFLTRCDEEKARYALIRRAIKPAELKKIAADFIPSEFPRLAWGGVWERPLRSGVSLEWTVFAALVWALRAGGWAVAFPHLANAAIEEFFLGYNEFPVHHSGKAGHSALGPKPGVLIMAALTPKAIAFKNGKWVSIFREGCAYHRIYSEEPYEERPDILIAPGKPAQGFPNYREEKNVVAYCYVVNESQTVEGILRAINSMNPSIIQRSPSKGYQFEALAIIECSVSKLQKRALDQIGRYESRFFRRGDAKLVLISGRQVAIPWACHIVELLVPAAALRENLAAVSIDIVETMLPKT